MKKGFKILLILVMIIFSTGCIKYDSTMEIKSDKSMNYSVIYAFKKDLMQQDNVLTDDEIKAIKDKGFIISNYEDDEYKGIEVKYHVDNIDNISTPNEKPYSLNDIFDEEKGADMSEVFNIEEGIFKNDYKANFILSFESEENSSVDTKEPSFGSITNGNGEEISFDDEDEEYDSIPIDGLDGLEGLDNLNEMASYEIFFNVKLPYKAKSHNATKVLDDGKHLVWDLSKSGINEESNIKFEFSIYNTTILYISIGIAGVLLLIIIFSIINNIASKKPKEEKKVSFTTMSTQDSKADSNKIVQEQILGERVVKPESFIPTDVDSIKEVMPVNSTPVQVENTENQGSINLEALSSISDEHKETVKEEVEVDKNDKLSEDASINLFENSPEAEKMVSKDEGTAIDASINIFDTPMTVEEEKNKTE